MATKQTSLHPLTLDQAELGQTFRVDAIHAPHTAPEWSRWLEEIGFIPGEQVTLMAKGIPGGDPLVIRVGQSTFALRRAEAACVRITDKDKRSSTCSIEQTQGQAA